VSAEASENYIFGLTMPNRLRYSTNIQKDQSRITTNAFVFLNCILALSPCRVP